MKHRLPKPIINFSSKSMPIELLICGGKVDSDYPWASRFIGGWPIPSWQRELVWSLDQDISFIESVFIGYDLGSVMINDHFVNENNVMRKMSDALIDGQQRTSALVRFVHNKFPVNGLYWKDLTRTEQRIFREREIGLKSIRCFDEEKLKMVYNHLNFSGVAHTQEEMA